MKITLLTGAVLFSQSAAAQSPSSLSGSVTDPHGAPVYAAIVSIAGTSLVVRTDERGEFELAGVMPGIVELHVRRIGFEPVTERVDVTEQATRNRFHITLPILAAALEPVVVRSIATFRGRLAGYYERVRRRSGGHFILRDEIDRNEHRSLSELVASAPGVRGVQLRSGGGAVRMRGRNCRPLVWLDGVPMPAGEVDLDAFPVTSLHGIELYLGSSTAPIDYTGHQNRSGCGTILLWSRGRDTDPVNRPPEQRLDLEELVASRSVYTVDQVDRRAELASAQRPEVTYPPELLAAGVSGSVVAEFVVNAEGKVEAGSFAIVSSTHPLFSAAVSRSLIRSTYVPALKNGRPVRQVVQQLFAFRPAGGLSANR